MKKVINRSDVFPYEIAVLSFVPWIGVLFGITSIIWGALKKKPKLKVIGFVGIFMTVLYGSLYYYGIKRGIFSSVYFESTWQGMFSHIINIWFWIMIVATFLTFALIILSKIFHQKFFSLKGAFMGFLIWTSIKIPIYLEEHLDIFGVISGEDWGFVILYMFSVVGFVIGGFVVGLSLERKIE
jgi:hypothetical protein